jgi:hypothetical protein
MESKTRPSNEATTNTQPKDLTCWRTATSPQCLRVEMTNEFHIFAYGYFQHAKFSRQNGVEIVEIRFQDQVVKVKGSGLGALCEALERLAVERIKLCPEKYGAIGRNDGIVEEIEIKSRGRENQQVAGH